MSNEGASSSSNAGKLDTREQTRAAISQIRNKGHVRVPTIDFSLHRQEDGSVVSTQERVIKEVQAPAFKKPTDEEFFSDETRTKPNIAFLKNHFYREGRLQDEQALWIIEHATKLIREEPNLLEVDAPITGTSLSLFSI